MRFGLFVPPLGPLAHPARLADLAAEAEEAGWEGFFVWDHVLARVDKVVADPLVALAAGACATRRLRLGPMVTPLARRRPDGVFAISTGHSLGGTEVAHILDTVHRHRAVEGPFEIVV